jgi:hypothetical protein
MDLNSPFFNRIRIKPACDEPRATGEPRCERAGCAEPGTFRAPKGRAQEGQYWRFCKDHVREYNQSYNYFAGMSDDAVMAYQKDATIGHRPTWSMGVNAASQRDGGRLRLHRPVGRVALGRLRTSAACARAAGSEAARPRAEGLGDARA